MILLVTQPLISFSPTSINFGTVKLKSVSSITVVVSNPGTSPLTISNIAWAQHNEDDDLFTITNHCKSPVAPGGTCNFTVTFSAPTSWRAIPIRCWCTDNVKGSPQQLPVTANVVKH